MSFSISRPKKDSLIYEDDVGTVTFEVPANIQSEALEKDHMVDIEGNIDLATMDAWLTEVLETTRTWLKK